MEPTLSAATLEALKLFALSSGIDVGSSGDEIVSAVRDHFDVQDKDQTFHYEYKNESREVRFSVKGVKRELGQTLSSTGLTIWRAAEHLNNWIFENPQRFAGKTVCELGAGLGVVSILLGKLEVAQCVVATDGDDDTMTLLANNVADTDSTVLTEKLYWGEHEQFIARFPDKFDVLCAADVIYEKEQIEPLINSVTRILKDDGEFFLAFARRNVPIDAVIAEALRCGLAYDIADEDPSTSEHIFRFFWAKV